MHAQPPDSARRNAWRLARPCATDWACWCSPTAPCPCRCNACWACPLSATTRPSSAWPVPPRMTTHGAPGAARAPPTCPWMPTPCLPACRCLLGGRCGCPRVMRSRCCATRPAYRSRGGTRWGAAAWVYGRRATPTGWCWQAMPTYTPPCGRRPSPRWRALAHRPWPRLPTAHAWTNARRCAALPTMHGSSRPTARSRRYCAILPPAPRAAQVSGRGARAGIS